MKLYTEEKIINYLTNHRSTITIYDLQNIPHIELPTYEEIEKSSNIRYIDKYKDIWKFGAIWMRDKIQGGNK